MPAETTRAQSTPAQTTPATPRRSRADGLRNRELLLSAAHDAFAAADGRAVSLEGIAKAAGVGIGTLYRHFPTREALVEAVYESELSSLTDPATLPSGPADRALRLWMERYAVFVATKRGMMDVLRAGWASGSIATPSTRERINGVVDGYLTAGADEGVLRAGIVADDVTAALLGAFQSTATSDDPEQIGRLLDLLVAGVRA